MELGEKDEGVKKYRLAVTKWPWGCKKKKGKKERKKEREVYKILKRAENKTEKRDI